MLCNVPRKYRAKTVCLAMSLSEAWWDQASSGDQASLVCSVVKSCNRFSRLLLRDGDDAILHISNYHAGHIVD